MEITEVEETQRVKTSIKKRYYSKCDQTVTMRKRVNIPTSRGDSTHDAVVFSHRARSYYETDNLSALFSPEKTLLIFPRR